MSGGISNAGSTWSIDVEVRYVEASGQLVTTTLGKVDGSEVVRGRPLPEIPDVSGPAELSGVVVDSDDRLADRLRESQFGSGPQPTPP